MRGEREAISEPRSNVLDENRVQRELHRDLPPLAGESGLPGGVGFRLLDGHRAEYAHAMVHGTSV